MQVLHVLVAYKILYLSRGGVLYFQIILTWVPIELKLSTFSTVLKLEGKKGMQL